MQVDAECLFLKLWRNWQCYCMFLEVKSQLLLFRLTICLFCFVCVVALRSESTAIVLAAGGMVSSLTTLFPGQV